MVLLTWLMGGMPAAMFTSQDRWLFLQQVQHNKHAHCQLVPVLLEKHGQDGDGFEDRTI